MLQTIDAVAGRWREAVDAVPGYEVVEDGKIFRTSFLDSFVFSSEHRRALDLLMGMMAESEGRPVHQVLPGREVETGFGPAYCIEARARVPDLHPDRDWVRERAILCRADWGDPPLSGSSGKFVLFVGRGAMAGRDGRGITVRDFRGLQELPLDQYGGQAGRSVYRPRSSGEALHLSRVPEPGRSSERQERAPRADPADRFSPRLSGGRSAALPVQAL